MSTRRLTVILAADVAGFSAMMERDEEATAERIRRLRAEVIEPALARYHGRLVKATGDGFLAEFASPVEAVRSAVAIQDQLTSGDLKLRIGINLGDIIVENDGDVFGGGVNVAARLEQMADPGAIYISEEVHRHIIGKVERQFEDRGDQQVKNIVSPVRVFALAAAQSQRPEPKSLTLPDKPSIAVLPFQNMSGDLAQEYFADGVVEEIITSLTQFRYLFVIARNSTFTYKKRAVDVRQVGRDLGVRYVLEGSIRKLGDRVRINGQLVEAETGRHVWADRFEDEASNIFELQDRIAAAVVGAIEPNLRIAETERLRSKPTQSLGAYDHYLLALAQSYTWTRQGFEAAQAHILAAVAIDPAYSLAKATGSRIVMMRKMQSFASESDVRLGVAWADEALAAHRDDPTTLRSAGHSIALLGRDFDKGLFAVKRAVSIAPNSAQVLSGSGWVHAYVGETQTAVAHFRQAMRLSPIDPEKITFLSGLALAYIVARDYEAALNCSLAAIPEKPSAVPLRMAAVSLAHLGRLDEARVIGRRLIELTPEFRIATAIAPPRDPEACERFIAGLRMAGLPE